MMRMAVSLFVLAIALLVLQLGLNVLLVWMLLHGQWTNCVVIVCAHLAIGYFARVLKGLCDQL